MSRARRTSLVTLQRRIAGQDSAGQPVESWTNLRKEWATIEAISGREYFTASGEHASITHRIKMASGSGVLPRDRILYASRIFDVRSVIDSTTRGTDLELMCVEFVG